MPAVFDSPIFIVAALLVVSSIYARWMWGRFCIGRYDALWSSTAIIGIQLMSAFRTDNPPLALVATFYHIALVVAVYSLCRGLGKAKPGA